MQVESWEKNSVQTGAEAFKSASSVGVTGADVLEPFLPNELIETSGDNFLNETRRFLYSVLKSLRAAKPTWENAILLNGWFSVDPNTWNEAQYRLNVLGQVEFRGLIRNPTVSTIGTIFNLPIDLRPLKQHLFTVPANGGSATARIDVYPTGEVNLVNYNTGADGFFISLDNIRYSID